MGAHKRLLENLFDYPGEQFTVGPVEDPEELLAFLEESEHLEFNYDLLERMRTVGFPTGRHPFQMGTLGLRTDSTVAELDRIIATRQIPIWAFACALRAACTDTEFPLEHGGIQNIFWIPEPIVVYEEVTDGKLHVRPHAGAPLERFARVFFHGSPLF